MDYITKSCCLILIIFTIITIIIEYIFYPSNRINIKIKGYFLHFINTFIKIAFILNILLQLISIIHIYLALYQESILDEHTVNNYIIGLNDELTKTYENSKERLENGIFFRLIDIYKTKPYSFHFPLYHYSNNEKDILLCLIMGYFLIRKIMYFFEKNCKIWFYNFRSKEILNYPKKIDVNYRVNN